MGSASAGAARTPRPPRPRGSYPARRQGLSWGAVFRGFWEYLSGRAVETAGEKMRRPLRRQTPRPRCDDRSLNLGSINQGAFMTPTGKTLPRFRPPGPEKTIRGWRSLPTGAVLFSQSVKGCRCGYRRCPSSGDAPHRTIRSAPSQRERYMGIRRERGGRFVEALSGRFLRCPTRSGRVSRPSGIPRAWISSSCPVHRLSPGGPPAHAAAGSNPLIRLTVIDGVLFPDWRTHRIRAVPTAVLDGRFRWSAHRAERIALLPRATRS